MKINSSKPHLKLILLSLWLLFTSAMVIWWWMHAITDFNIAIESIEATEKHRRMMTWEGSAFLAAILFAAYSLWIFIKRDILRHNQLKIFFSNFSHDIKTSITRLRLQSEVLQDQKEFAGDEKLKQLIRDISRLDLQLENSLYISQDHNFNVYPENVLISELIRSVKNDFSEIEIYLTQDARVLADRRLFICVLRNFINNSVVHGAATEIRISVSQNSEVIELLVTDNGEGSKSDSKGFGIGLEICRQLLLKMNGSFSVTSKSPLFKVLIKIPGALT